VKKEPGYLSQTIQIGQGLLRGKRGAEDKVYAYLGIPYAAPPVGPWRWKSPQPPVSWTGIREAVEFGPRSMQGSIYSDMVFRDKGPSEDCLYLNVWTPAKAPDKLPVMVWIHGGGYKSGSSSEPRQNGENLARKGVVVVSFNYRLGVFGFLALPELTRETDSHSSGNYGLLDQVAALEWVKSNIAAFGGDRDNVTIFGESAGSFSVSGLMATPLARSLFHKAVGESGALFGPSLTPNPLALAEKDGLKFMKSLGAKTLAQLRTKSANDLLQATLKPNAPHFFPNIDGAFFPKAVDAIYAKGQQAHVPLLAGWNSAEGSYRAILKDAPATKENFIKAAKAMFGSNTGAFLKLYPAGTDTEAKQSAQDLGGDFFIAYSTWKWLDRQSATGQKPVYRYRFEQAPPLSAGAKPGTRSTGAYHSCEIEYVFGNLDSKKLPWRPEDRQLSDLVSAYWTNFAKNGDPNGPGLPKWPVYGVKSRHALLRLNPIPSAAADIYRKRYQFLDKFHP
jgi:para-nitrobenzyl esterase